MIAIKRIYDPPGSEDGYRILVDRLWPRGISKERACIDQWRKDLAPSDRLRKWFNHKPENWKEFRRRYREELGPRINEVKKLVRQQRPKRVTLLYGARDEQHNNAAALKEFLQSRTKLSAPSTKTNRSAPKPRNRRRGSPGRE